MANGLTVATSLTEKSHQTLLSRTGNNFGKTLDLLFTSGWPVGITLPNGIDSIGSEDVAKLALVLEPRYHFTDFADSSAEGIFYQHPPYRNINSNYPTRFYQLARFGNTSKQRWFYAFNLTPGPSNPANETATAGLLENPYKSLPEQQNHHHNHSNKRKHDGDDHDRRDPPEGYVCRICNIPGHFIRDCPNKQEPSSRRPPHGYVCRKCNVPGHFISDCPSSHPSHNQEGAGSKQTCWFCLANPEIERHLLVSIGGSAYLSLPKGELTPGHVLLVTIDHLANSLSLIHQGTLGGTNEETRLDMHKYKLSIQQYFESMGCGTVIYETSLSSQHHLNVNFVPVPKDLCAVVGDVFQRRATEEGMNLDPFDPTPSDDRPNESIPKEKYFWIEMPDGKQYLYDFSLQGSRRFDLQFPRQVLAEVLKLDKSKEDWKACVKTQEEETSDAERFREGFERFDFTLE